MFNKILSHPDVLYSCHIDNMITKQDTSLALAVKKFHDIGKLRNNFQKYIRGEKITGDKSHSELSAYIFLKVFQNKFSDIELLFGYIAILRHHGYIYDLNIFIDNIDDIFNISDEAFQEIWENLRYVDIYGDELLNMDSSLSDIQKLLIRLKKILSGGIGKKRKEFNIADYTAFKGLFSNLVYSDKYEAIFHQKREENFNVNFSLKEKYNSFMNNLNNDSAISKERNKYSDTVLENYKKNQKKNKIFKMIGVTGIGKTLSSLRVAIEMKKKKIIYVLPFTNIIEQTFTLFNEIYKETDIKVLQNHYRNNPYCINENENVEMDSRQLSMNKFLTNNFGGDINITTTYQLFYALFGNENSDFVKFEQMKDSVIIIDEIQSINEDIKSDFLYLCEKISIEFNINFIFMSATMPIISITHCDITDYNHLSLFNRYKIEFDLTINQAEQYIDKCLELYNKYKSVLCVVNQIGTVKLLYLEFLEKNNDTNVFILHGEMTVIDKENIIEKVKRAIFNNEKVILFSTQSIEAGVDLDFQVGIREFSPFSSIVQTSGRVNRNNKYNQASLFVFGEISKYSKLIYGGLLNKTKNIIKNKVIEESEIFKFNEKYFNILDDSNSGINFNGFYRNLEFEKIKEYIDPYFKNNYKKIVYIEPSFCYFSNFEKKYFEIQNDKRIDIFEKKDKISNLFYEIIDFSVSVNKKVYNMIEAKSILNGMIEYVEFSSLGSYEKEFGFGIS